MWVFQFEDRCTKQTDTIKTLTERGMIYLTSHLYRPLGCSKSEDPYPKCWDYCCHSEDHQQSGGRQSFLWPHLTALNRHAGYPPSLILEKINNVKILHGFNVKIQYNSSFSLLLQFFLVACWETCHLSSVPPHKYQTLWTQDCEAVAKQSSLRHFRRLLKATSSPENGDSQWFYLVK